MKLFTITATPVRTGDTPEVSEFKLQNYTKVVAQHLKAYGIDGFTIYQVQGYWMGESEVSFKIELAIDSNPERVYTVAEQLKVLYEQDSVMLTLPNNTVKFI